VKWAPVGAVQVQVVAEDVLDEGVEGLGGLARRAHEGDVAADGGGVERDEELFLGGEVRVERGRAHPGGRGEIAHVEGEVGAALDPAAGGVEDVDAPLLPVAPAGRRSRRAALAAALGAGVGSGG
jgi:hypothetical protein